MTDNNTNNNIFRLCTTCAHNIFGSVVLDLLVCIIKDAGGYGD